MDKKNIKKSEIIQKKDLLSFILEKPSPIHQIHLGEGLFKELTQYFKRSDYFRLPCCWGGKEMPVHVCLQKPSTVSINLFIYRANEALKLVSCCKIPELAPNQMILFYDSQKKESILMEDSASSG